MDMKGFVSAIPARVSREKKPAVWIPVVEIYHQSAAIQHCDNAINRSSLSKAAPESIDSAALPMSSSRVPAVRKSDSSASNHAALRSSCRSAGFSFDNYPVHHLDGAISNCRNVLVMRHHDDSEFV